METKDKTINGKTKGLHMEILKLHKEMCVQSLRETVKCIDKGKNERMLHKDAFLRMCEVVFTFKPGTYIKRGQCSVPGWVKVPSLKLLKTNWSRCQKLKSKQKREKRENKRSPHGSSKTGVLYKEICVQSLWETVKCRDNGKNKRMLHKDAFLRMCVHTCVWVRVSESAEAGTTNGEFCFFKRPSCFLSKMKHEL